MNIIKKIFSKNIQITEEKDYTCIIIKVECSMKYFINFINKTKYKDILKNIDINNLLFENNLLPQTILIIKKDLYSYILITDKYKTRITKKSIEENITLKTEKEKPQYEIIKDNIKYSNNTDNNTKSYLLSVISTILDELSSLPYISEFINIKEIYNIFNLINKKDYYPLINNEIITLSWQNKYGSTDISKKYRATLDIILNRTNEKIGEISFNLLYKPEHSYVGNVSYKIKDEFTNNHYATQALSLLKDLIRSQICFEKKDLFISTSTENIRSQKVALNNDGELFYEGEVPKSDPISRFSGISNVRIYRIKI